MSRRRGALRDPDGRSRGAPARPQLQASAWQLLTPRPGPQGSPEGWLSSPHAPSPERLSPARAATRPPGLFVMGNKLFKRDGIEPQIMCFAPSNTKEQAISPPQPTGGRGSPAPQNAFLPTRHVLGVNKLS